MFKPTLIHKKDHKRNVGLNMNSEKSYSTQKSKND